MIGGLIKEQEIAASGKGSCQPGAVLLASGEVGDTIGVPIHFETQAMQYCTHFMLEGESPQGLKPGLKVAQAIKTGDIFGLVGEVSGFIYLGQQTPAYYARQVAASITEYGNSLLSPFFGGMMAYDWDANIAFDCPGHQGGQFYRKSPAGQLFFKHLGERIFRNDLCNADVDLGDLLIHEGAAVEAQKNAARVFGADKTYFVLNGTSTSNKFWYSEEVNCV